MINSNLELARIRSQAFWFLSDCFLVPPDSSRLQEVTQRFSEAGEGLAPRCGVLGSTDALEDQVLQLRREHTRLFGGIKPGYGPPPPYEGLYRESRATGACSESVQAAYAEAGYAHLPDKLQAPDHLAVELRFMALLAYKEAEARTTHRDAEAAVSKTRQQRFLAYHLHCWVPAYCRRLCRETATAYYRDIAQLTADAVVQASAQLCEERSVKMP